jgi:hypothetical protein
MPDTRCEEVPPDCLNVFLHVWDDLDDQLPPADSKSLRAHVASCGSCRDYHRFQVRFLDTLATLRPHAPAPRHVRARVLNRLATAGYAPR